MRDALYDGVESRVVVAPFPCKVEDGVAVPLRAGQGAVVACGQYSALAGIGRLRLRGRRGRAVVVRQLLVLHSLAIGILALVRDGGAAVDVLVTRVDCEVYKHYALFVPADAYAAPYRHVESGVQLFVAELLAHSGDGDGGGRCGLLRCGARLAGDLAVVAHDAPRLDFHIRSTNTLSGRTARIGWDDPRLRRPFATASEPGRPRLSGGCLAALLPARAPRGPAGVLARGYPRPAHVVCLPRQGTVCGRAHAAPSCSLARPRPDPGVPAIAVDRDVLDLGGGGGGGPFRDWWHP